MEEVEDQGIVFEKKEEKQVKKETSKKQLNKIVKELVGMIKIANDEHLNIMKERLKMLEEDIRSTLYNKPKSEEKIPAVEYEQIIEENIELKQELNQINQNC